MEDNTAQLWHLMPHEDESDFALFNLWLDCGSPKLGGWQKTHPHLDIVAGMSVASLYAVSGRNEWRARSAAWGAWRRRMDQDAALVVSHDWAEKTSDLMALYHELITNTLQTHLERGTVMDPRELIAAMKEFTAAGRLMEGKSTANHAVLLTEATEGANHVQINQLHSLLKEMDRTS